MRFSGGMLLYLKPIKQADNHNKKFILQNFYYWLGEGAAQHCCCGERKEKLTAKNIVISNYEI